MNTYRVSIQNAAMNTPRHFDVDAARPSVAINRALYGLDRSDVVSAWCRLYASNIDPRENFQKVRAL